MSETGGGKEDIQVLRDVLLKPLYEQNKVRDQKLVQFVEQFGAKLTTRLRELEKRIDLLAEEIDKRENMVSGIGEGIACLGQELRQLASKAESLQVAPVSRRTASAQSGEAEPRHRETAGAEGVEPDPTPGQAASDEWDEVESRNLPAAAAESDEAEALPRQAATDEWDEVEFPASSSRRSRKR